MKNLAIFLLLLPTTLRASYIPLEELMPGQLRFSSKNVEDKVEKAIQRGSVIYNEETGSFEGKYFDGKSLFPDAKAFPVVKRSSDYVLLDGHHAVLAALTFGLRWIPIKEVADLGHLSEDAFWKEMERNGWAYLYDLKGVRRLPPTDFHELQDDPNRYFAALTARKYPSDGDLSKSRGAEHPLWIKIGNDIPYIEFRISDALLSNDLYYQYDMGNDLDETFIEKARQILLEAKIPGLHVVPQRKHWRDISSLPTSKAIGSDDPNFNCTILSYS